MLNPGRIGAVAAIGCGEVEVYARPRVAILSTGNEVVEPGTPLGPARSSTSTASRWPRSSRRMAASPTPRRPVDDSVEALGAALDACAGADIIVFSGGSSVGERDLIVDLIASRGEMIFHGIAVKPGKPTAFARLHAGGTPFFGMPGNPTSCLSNAYVLLVPFLRAVARLPPLRGRTLRVPLGRRIVSQAGRLQFYTVKLEGGVRCRRSKDRATSPASHRPTATSRFPRTRASSKRAKSGSHALLNCAIWSSGHRWSLFGNC